ncbi:cytokine receptor-like factor 3 [Nilaparvata lugens]|uniref:cytokine receptor-like factor 3 n=1 Tax=Nilaparvata lugens TaxID=108931 RepID=UPI00193E7F89|nr:cytokine receptor-like factor 3 [Nilaparvata lugens]
MEEFCRKSILESIDLATDYSVKLGDLILSITEAKKQIQDTSHLSSSEIDKVFDALSSCLLMALEKRRAALKGKVERIEEQSLKPLNECQKVVQQKLEMTKKYIVEGRDILDQLQNKKVPVDVKTNSNYVDKASLMGGLPAVPGLNEVPALTFQCDLDAIKETLLQEIDDIGSVSPMGPVQLTFVEEKPGGLLVHWEEVELDRPIDVQSFRLQVASGSFPDANQNHTLAQYRDAYEGQDSSHLIRDLCPGQAYTLRVCCMDAGSRSWSAWSVPRVAVTHAPPYVWRDCRPHYATSVGNKIACKLTADKVVLLSSDMLVGANHSIQFQVLEFGETSDWTDGLGLAKDVISTDLNQSGVLFINAKGHVFLDKKEKTTRLPPLTKGCRVSFTCEYFRQQKKMRVNIDSMDKAVTYDWILPAPSFYFVMCFRSPGWKILVE